MLKEAGTYKAEMLLRIPSHLGDFAGFEREGTRTRGCGWVRVREFIANSAHLEYMRLRGMQ